MRHLLAGSALALVASAAHAGMLPVEKDELTLGFIKLTDMAPLAVAAEMGFFEDEGLYVTLEPQANWKVLLDGVISGELDGAHMLAGQPLAATIGYGTGAHIVTPFSMDLNGNAITVSNAVWEEMKPHVPAGPDGRPCTRSPPPRCCPPSTRPRRRAGPSTWAWCSRSPPTTTSCATGSPPAASTRASTSPEDTTGQIDADVLISVTPPPQMPATLEAGTISGYSVGEPWNQEAVFKGIGVPVITDADISQTTPRRSSA